MFQSCFIKKKKMQDALIDGRDQKVGGETNKKLLVNQVHTLVSKSFCSPSIQMRSP